MRKNETNREKNETKPKKEGDKQRRNEKGRDLMRKIQETKTRERTTWSENKGN